MKTKITLFTICVICVSRIASAKSDSARLPAVTVPAAAVNSAGMSATVSKEARNKAIALRVFEENFNQGKFQVADEIYARDFENHGLYRTAYLQEDQDAVHAEKKAFPDLKMTVNMMVAEGDLVSVMWTFRGTHTAAGYGGIPPTGAKIAFRGITVWRIVDGKIRDEWTAFDEMTIYRQIVSHLKWPLIGMFIAFLAVVVILERVVCAIIWRVWLRSKRMVGPDSKHAAVG
jgi:predicted ester cyclase